MYKRRDTHEFLNKQDDERDRNPLKKKRIHIPIYQFLYSLRETLRRVVREKDLSKGTRGRDEGLGRWNLISLRLETQQSSCPRSKKQTQEGRTTRNLTEVCHSIPQFPKYSKQRKRELRPTDNRLTRKCTQKNERSTNSFHLY